MQHDMGYVYILTNPSFREDWVKIGKSSRPVDVRSKELDNTAVPLPFRIYATLKTSKYDAVEKAIHKQIDLINPSMRVRKGREFFNVHPSKALEIFKITASMQDDYEIAIYDEIGENIVEIISSEKEDENEHYFYCHNKRGAEAKGWLSDDGKHFFVCRGSRIAANPVPTFRYINLRDEIIRQHCSDNLTLKDNVEFDSPSMASTILLGSSSNGWADWVDENKKTLDEVYRKRKEIEDVKE